MKLFTLLFITFFGATHLTAQTLGVETSKGAKGYYSQINSAANKKADGTLNVENIFLGTHGISIAFSKLSIKDSSYTLGPELGLGYSYTFILGKVEPKNDGSKRLVVDPHLVFGFVAEVGVSQSAKVNTDLEAGLKIGAFLGFDKIALAGGYDLLTKNYFLGLNTRIDLFEINEESAIIFKVW